MFKTMKSAELLTVNGGGHYVPKYNFYNIINLSKDKVLV